jgi:hypothetical protein
LITIIKIKYNLIISFIKSLENKSFDLLLIVIMYL